MYAILIIELQKIMKKSHIVISLTVFASIICIGMSPKPTRAGDCYADPVYEHDWTGTTNVGSFIRDEACMEGSVVMTTIPQGSSVHIIGETDGWYRVEWNGTRGWVGATLMSVTDKRLEGSIWGSYTQYMEHFPSKISGTVQAPESTTTSDEVGFGSTQSTSETSAVVTAQPISNTAESASNAGAFTSKNASTINKTLGYILLQVENHGEAWYVDPITEKRYYMKDGPTAYEMMRSFGLGITEADYAKVEAGNLTLKNRLRGRIILRVQEHGEAYYIHPKDLSVYYLQNGEEAYRIMRLYSLGITNTDLSGIPDEEIPLITKSASSSATIAQTSTQATSTASTSQTVDYTQYANISVSANQGDWKPSNIDLIALNEYWLDLVNDLRAEKGLSQLALDQRFVETATDWANYEISIGESTHTRPDDSSMHEWIDTYDLDFTDRYSEGGWSDNYFTENIAYEYIANRMDDAEAALDRTVEWMLEEEASNGAHYRTLYHPDWNTVGLGFAFEKLSYSNAKIYIVLHYGSLKR